MMNTGNKLFTIFITKNKRNIEE